MVFFYQVKVTFLTLDGKVLYVNGVGYGLAGGSQGGDTSVAGDPVFDTCLYDPEAPRGAKWSILPKFK